MNDEYVSLPDKTDSKNDSTVLSDLKNDLSLQMKSDLLQIHGIYDDKIVSLQKERDSAIKLLNEEFDDNVKDINNEREIEIQKYKDQIKERLSNILYPPQQIKATPWEWLFKLLRSYQPEAQ